MPGVLHTRRSPRLLATIVAVVLLAGCVQPPPRDLRLTWLDVTPPGVLPVTLATSPAGLVVAGTNDDDTAPALVDPSGGPVPLVPSEPYAASARIVAATAAGGTIRLIGGRAGGAHANTRWTVWDGPLAGPVTSRPQDFFTFGGHDAGPLLGTVVADGQPLIVGSRGGDAGPDAALYAVDGTVWRQLDTPTALHSANGVVLGFTAVASAGSQVVLVGDSVQADASGTVQTPALFYGTVGGTWRRVDLPAPASGPGLRHATAVACHETVCWVAGWASHPVVWRVSMPDGVLVQTSSLPGEPPASGDPVALVGLVGDRPVVATNAAEPTLTAGCGSTWTAAAAPGPSTALAGTGSDVYVIAQDRLWSAALPAC